MIVCRAELAPTIDKAVFPFLQGGPLMHAVAAKAVALKECLQPSYRTYAAAGRRQRPGARRRRWRRRACGRSPAARTPTSRCSTCAASGSPGTEAETRCDAARITLNKNAIPYDPQPPMVASGIRVGTPSVTTQGMGPRAR